QAQRRWIRSSASAENPAKMPMPFSDFCGCVLCDSAIASPRACTVQSARSINQATADRHAEKSHRLGQCPGGWTDLSCGKSHSENGGGETSSPSQALDGLGHAN